MSKEQPKALDEQKGGQPSSPAIGSMYWPLWKHMADTHNLILLESELEDICITVEDLKRRRKAKRRGLSWEAWWDCVVKHRRRREVTPKPDFLKYYLQHKSPIGALDEHRRLKSLFGSRRPYKCSHLWVGGSPLRCAWCKIVFVPKETSNTQRSGGEKGTE